MVDTSKLVVYKASAGSGKTFTLVSEYISLLVKEPSNFKKILAVTFTNKATQEMKLRILSQLYGVANGLEESNGYLEKIKKDTRLPETVIRNNAQVALHYLTHEYNNFRVQTIDAFFQSVLRNLARELGQTSNLRVDLNGDQVEAKAVDEIIEELEEGNEVLKWIDDYVQTNIDDNKSWNVIDQIKVFGKNIFQEFYKEHEEELNNCFSQPRFFNDLISQLRAERDGYKKKIREDSRLLLVDLHSICTDDSCFHRYVIGFLNNIYDRINKVPEEKGYFAVLQNPSDSAKWASGNEKKNPFYSLIISSVEAKDIPQRFGEFIDYYMSKWPRYYSCLLVLKHLSKLRLLHVIASRVEEDNKENHRFMLSDTQTLLKGLMKDTDVPFVYEKIGGLLKFIMIDEFQDTSSVQWANFKKLLLNCLSEEGSRNLIVGDVKQSIYRWRQGDWEILNNIKESIKPDDGTYLDIDNIVQERNLSMNFRSAENIINFNNVFFEMAVHQLDPQEASLDGNKKGKNANMEISSKQYKSLVKAYEDVAQEFPSWKERGQGYVHVRLYGDGTDYDEDIKKDLAGNVLMLLSKHYQQKDIAVLVRNKVGVLKAVDALSTVEFQGKPLTIVSEEAFRLDASLAVNILIYALRLLTHPDDVLIRGLLVNAYLRVPLREEDEFYESRLNCTMSDTYITMNGADSVESKQLTIEKLNESLPSYYVQNREELLRMAMVDLIDMLYGLFNLKNLEKQNAYISTFYDTLNNYLRDNPADIDDFLKEWEDNLSSTNIQSGEANGIRVMTIHKSKGLEFQNVLLPFCDWELEKTRDVVKWFEGAEKDGENLTHPLFSKLPLIPVDYKRDLLQSVFADDYRREHFQNIVDNLNLLYVAFTRAGKNLFISGKNIGSDQYQSKLLWNSLSAMHGELEGSIYDDDPNISKVAKNKWEKNNITENTYKPVTFEYGLLSEASYEQEKVSVNPFIQKGKDEEIKIVTYDKAVEFKQSNKSDEYLKDDEDSKQTTYMKVGTVLHNIFSSIKAIDDIDAQLKSLDEEGVTYSDEISGQELRETIQSALSDPQVKDWFTSQWTVFNECAILQYDKLSDSVIEYRPDRVIVNSDRSETIVIDYKFGKAHQGYLDQVRRYMQLLQQMGYKNVKGYLWYVMNKKVVPVEL